MLLAVYNRKGYFPFPFYLQLVVSTQVQGIGYFEVGSTVRWVGRAGYVGKITVDSKVTVGKQVNQYHTPWGLPIEHGSMCASTVYITQIIPPQILLALMVTMIMLSNALSLSQQANCLRLCCDRWQHVCPNIPCLITNNMFNDLRNCSVAGLCESDNQLRIFEI